MDQTGGTGGWEGQGGNQIFLSTVGLSRYISDCGNREDAF